MRQLTFSMAILFAVVGGCSQAEVQPKSAPDDSTLFSGMGNYHREITTSSPKVQKYFDQGMTWAYAFNHDEAIRSFTEATKLDPNCAMAYWGIALCYGPHINNPIVTPERANAAWKALKLAEAHKSSATKTEQDLIKALGNRYSASPMKDRAPLDKAYAGAMQAVYNKHRNDPDVCALYAESLMDLQPWDLWTIGGEPKGSTEEILEVLESALALNANHPGANHLYIHAVEASPFPEKGDKSATRLRTAVPASGHLVHMPSHIDVQLGRWKLASDQNEKAIDADNKYKKLSPQQQFYRVYMAHNYQFLSFSCMMEGRSERALWAANQTIAGIPADFARSNAALVDPAMMIVIDVFKRFGRWDDILAQPKPASYFPISTAMWHFSRAIAFAAKGNLDKAREEQSEFEAASQNVPQDATMSLNKAHAILAIADHFLKGEIAYREKKYDEAISELREAVTLEDHLLYMEPPEWIQPVRHTLAAVLMDAGKYHEAEEVYRKDLQVWPENGWSLYGLSQALEKQGSTAEAQEMERRFHDAWARSDVKISSSCLCAQKMATSRPATTPGTRRPIAGK